MGKHQISVRPFSARDLVFGLGLSREAGWNQLEEDWRRALALGGAGCFVAELEGRPAGTTMTCRFGAAAWIAMVLVSQRCRRGGIGTVLMRHALDYLDAGGVESVWLDATPLGQPLYEKLGFVVEATFLRYAGRPRPGTPAASLQTADIAELLELDRAVYGYDRGPLLRLLLESNAAAAIQRDGRLTGFLLWRPGYHAVQLGPCIADAEAGPALLADALARFSGQDVFIDVCETNVPARSLLEEAGLTIQRQLVRMRRGQAIPWDAERLCASFGPEKG